MELECIELKVVRSHSQLHLCYSGASHMAGLPHPGLSVSLFLWGVCVCKCVCMENRHIVYAEGYKFSGFPEQKYNLKEHVGTATQAHSFSKYWPCARLLSCREQRKCRQGLMIKLIKDQVLGLERELSS